MLLNLFLAGNEYVIELIVNIVVSIILIFYLFYMINNYLIDYIEKTKLYSGMINADDNDEILIYKNMIVNYHHDRLVVTRLDFINKKGEDRTIYVDPSNQVYLKTNQEYNVKTLANFLVELQER